MSAQIPIILLAAGQSSRMRGRDKLLEAVDGKPLLRRQAELALAVTDVGVFVTLPVTASGARHPRYDALDGLELVRVPVPDAAEGMNASLRRGFAALPPETPAAMVLLGDLPELTEDDLRSVLQAVDLKSNYTIWRGATSDGKPGHPTVFAACHFPKFARLGGDSGGRDIIQSAKDKTLLVRLSGQQARLDLDTPEDWAKWRSDRMPRDIDG